VKPRPDMQVERKRVAGPLGEMSGAFKLGELAIIASNGMGWDHVSVSRADRCPTWDEMELVKRLFFKDDECAMQLHVPPSDHINCHPNCLHLWRPQTADEIAIVKLTWGDEWPQGYPDKSPGVIPRPPAICVGPARH
jgi:hypothetical protein